MNVLSIDGEIAEETACRMEHAIDGQTIERLVCFIEYIFTCPRAGKDWIGAFLNYCSNDNRTRANCTLCIDKLKSTLQ